MSINLQLLCFNEKDAIKLQKVMQTKAQELLDLGHQVCIINLYVII